MSECYAEGAVIFREGDPAGPIYMVEQGTVRITKTTSGGLSEAVLGEVGPGGIFGEMSLVDDAPRMATAVALDPIVCISTTSTQFKRKLELIDPDALALFQKMIAYIRETMPFDARPEGIRAQGATSADAAARRMLDVLPGTVAALKYPPPLVVSVFRLFGEYIERRLPPSLR